MNTATVLFVAVSILACKAFKFEETVVATEDGDIYKVANLHDKNKDITIVKKDNEIEEVQTSAQNETFTIIKKNDTCYVMYGQDNFTECHDASENDDRFTDLELQRIKQECDGYQTVFVRALPCKNEKIQKRAICFNRRICRVYFRIIFGRRRVFVICFTIRKCY